MESSGYCGICLDNVTNPDFEQTTLPCGHSYHPECTITWLRQSRNKDCPECRGSLCYKTCGCKLPESLIVAGTSIHRKALDGSCPKCSAAPRSPFMIMNPFNGPINLPRNTGAEGPELGLFDMAQRGFLSNHGRHTLRSQRTLSNDVAPTGEIVHEFAQRTVTSIAIEQAFRPRQQQTQGENEQSTVEGGDRATETMSATTLENTSQPQETAHTTGVQGSNTQAATTIHRAPTPWPSFSNPDNSSAQSNSPLPPSSSTPSPFASTWDHTTISVRGIAPTRPSQPFAVESIFRSVNSTSGFRTISTSAPASTAASETMTASISSVMQNLSASVRTHMAQRDPEGEVQRQMAEQSRLINEEMFEHYEHTGLATSGMWDLSRQ